MELKDQGGQTTAELRSIRGELIEVKEQVKKTNGRVTLLERIWENARGRVAVVATLAGIVATFVWGWIKTKITVDL